MYQLACEAGQKLDSIQKPKRRNGEVGGDKKFSTPEEEETGGRMQGRVWPPNLNWLHLESCLSSGTVSQLKELQFVKSVFQVFMDVDIVSSPCRQANDRAYPLPDSHPIYQKMLFFCSINEYPISTP